MIQSRASESMLCRFLAVVTQPRTAALLCVLLWIVVRLSLPAREAQLLDNTLLLTAATLAIALPGGFILGVVLARTDLPGRGLARFWLPTILLTPLYLQCAAWQMGWGGQGWWTYWIGATTRPWFDGWPAAVWVHSQAAIPWVTVCVFAAARRCESAVEETALLELSTAAVWRRVLLPRLLPALAPAAAIIALQTTTEIGITDFFRIRTWAEEVYIDRALGGWEVINDQPAAAPALDAYPSWCSPSVRVGIAQCAGLAWLLMFGLRRSQLLSTAPREAPLIYRWGRYRPLAGALWVVWLVIALGLPLGSLLIKAGWYARWNGETLERGWSLLRLLGMVATAPVRYHQAILTTLSAAIPAIIAALALAGWLTARGSRQLLTIGWWSMLMLAVIPGSLLGIGLIELLNAPGRPVLNAIYDHPQAIMGLVMLLRAWPLVWVIMVTAAAQIPTGQREAAALEGESTRTAIRRLCPQLAPWWIAALAVGLTAAVGELSAVILVHPPGYTPLSVELFRLLHSDYEAEVAGLCLAMISAFAGVTWCVGKLLSAHRARYNVDV